jgi:hypothetical protein
MSEEEFEARWIAQFSRCLSEIAGQSIERQVIQKDQRHLAGARRQQVIDWTIEAMGRLDALVNHSGRVKIMVGCACQYPKSELEMMKKAYAETKNIDLVHRMLHRQFVSFLVARLKLDKELIDTILQRGWGLAGVREGNTITATKIPKSAFLVKYFEETDSQRRRQLYCHCVRVRDLLKTPQRRLSPTYCYCGAGFYKGIWDEILQEPVEVEVLSTVMDGDDVCQFAIHLPCGR